MKLFFFLFSLFFFQNLNAQCEFPAYYSGMELYKQKKYKDALIQFAIFLETNNCGCQKHVAYFYKAKILNKLGKPENSIKKCYLNAIKNGWSTSNQVEDANLEKIINSISIEEIELNQKKYWNSIIDIDYYLEIIGIDHSDQFIRKPIDEKLDDDTVWIIDTLLKVEFRELMKEKGEIPNYSNVGNGISNGYFALFLHMVRDGSRDSLDFEYLEPELLKEMKKGNIPPHFYAAVIDEYYVQVKNELAPYGSYNFIKPKDKEKYKKEVEKRKINIGMQIK